MFIPIPYRFHDGRAFDAIPAMNGIVIALNVIAFCIDWHPVVGLGTGFVSVMTYAFGHANLWHLTGNMFALLVFGTPVNRRLGNGWYCLVYFGTVITLGLFARLFTGGLLMGASGAIFSIIAIALMLFPSALIEIAYFALFPATLICGMAAPPKHWVDWFIRWDTFHIRAWSGLFLVPALELWGLIWNGWNWTNLAHILGLACGVAAVLLLPTAITLNRRRSLSLSEI